LYNKIHFKWKFQLLGSIASGSYGKVYHVRKRDSGEEYALKVLSKSQVCIHLYLVFYLKLIGLKMWVSQLIAENGVKQVKNEVGIQSMCGHHPFILSCPFFWQSRTKLFIGTLNFILSFTVSDHILNFSQ